MAASSDLRFSISSPAMANLIMTASVSCSEASGYIVGEVKVCTTKLTTDHEAAETVQRTVIVHKIVPFGNQKRFADFIRAFGDGTALQCEMEDGSQVVGYFEALRGVPHKLTLTERCLLKRLAKQPVIEQCGSFFVRVTTCEHEQLTRMTTRYGVTHVSLSGHQRDLPFEVINLGEMSHGECKRCASRDYRLLSRRTFVNLRLDAWLEEIHAAQSAILQRLDVEVDAFHLLSLSKQRIMMAAINPRSEKVQNLPLLCVETILKFTPTYKIVRLCSNAIPLPGSFWNCGLESVLKKRLPLSLLEDSRTYFPWLVDITGSKIATVKNPDMFRFSPLRDFIESATLTLRAVSKYWYDEPLPLSVEHGNALLSHMPNVVRLALVVGFSAYKYEGKDLFEPCTKHMLPQLQSFEVRTSPRFGGMRSQEMDEAFVHFIAEARIADMNCVRRLVLPVAAFDSLLQTSNNQSTRMQAVLAALRSLGIQENSPFARAGNVPAALSIVSRSCGQLSQLQVVVRGEFSAYLAAFRALHGLTALGLCVCQADLTGLTFDGSGAIRSVSDFRIVRSYFADGTTVFKIATFFPNARAVALLANNSTDPLQLATSLFGERQLFPVVAKLSCFFNGDEMRFLSSQMLSQFLANPHLPEAVDLSQVICLTLARDANLLTTIFCTMQASSIKSLLIRGPVHREALPRLQSHIGLNGDDAKVSAWKNRDLGDQPGMPLLTTEISQQTDFKIVGLKTSGNLKDDRFTIRVFHQLANRADIFD